MKSQRFVSWRERREALVRVRANGLTPEEVDERAADLALGDVEPLCSEIVKVFEGEVESIEVNEIEPSLARFFLD